MCIKGKTLEATASDYVAIWYSTSWEHKRDSQMSLDHGISSFCWIYVPSEVRRTNLEPNYFIKLKPHQLFHDALLFDFQKVTAVPAATPAFLHTVIICIKWAGNTMRQTRVKSTSIETRGGTRGICIRRSYEPQTQWVNVTYQAPHNGSHLDLMSTSPYIFQAITLELTRTYTSRHRIKALNMYS